MSKDYILVKTIAEIFDIQKTSCREWLRERDFTFIKVRIKALGNHQNLALTFSEAKRAIAERVESGFEVVGEEIPEELKGIG